MVAACAAQVASVADASRAGHACMYYVCLSVCFNICTRSVPYRNLSWVPALRSLCLRSQGTSNGFHSGHRGSVLGPAVCIVLCPPVCMHGFAQDGTLETPAELPAQGRKPAGRRPGDGKAKAKGKAKCKAKATAKPKGKALAKGHAKAKGKAKAAGKVVAKRRVSVKTPPAKHTRETPSKCNGGTGECEEEERPEIDPCVDVDDGVADTMPKGKAPMKGTKVKPTTDRCACCIVFSSDRRNATAGSQSFLRGTVVVRIITRDSSIG